jgi:hypothetical protein
VTDQVLGDFAANVGSRDYLMFDHYPFVKSGLQAERFYKELDMFRRVALPTHMKTGYYLQAVNGGNLTNMTEAQFRMQFNTALAFGNKQLSYFLWWDTDCSTGKTGVVNCKGEPSYFYPWIGQNNARAHAMSDVLFNADAEQVYLTGANTYTMQRLPSGFFVQPSTNDAFLFSYLRDKNNGRNYVMVVNQSQTAASTNTLTFANEIGSVEEVSQADGSLIPVALTGNAVTKTFAAGEAVLYALPASYDFESATKVDKTALEAAVSGAEALAEADYTAESWAGLAPVLADAQQVLADQFVAQAPVDAAVEAVAQAVAALVAKPATEPVTLTVTATPRCAAGKAQVSVVLKNTSDTPASVSSAGPWGSKSFPQVLAGKSASQVFDSKAKSIVGGTVTVQAVSLPDGDRTGTVTVNYNPITCG